MLQSKINESSEKWCFKRFFNPAIPHLQRFKRESCCLPFSAILLLLYVYSTRWSTIVLTILQHKYPFPPINIHCFTMVKKSEGEGGNGRGFAKFPLASQSLFSTSTFVFSFFSFAFISTLFLHLVSRKIFIFPHSCSVLFYFWDVENRTK
ncbi:hypothetical protein BX070DRAFT_142693 [Coemansia spiralis]|nr:hypothetical protein BX070DRAFT_142693 [Coemansia spiralis]